MKKFMLLLSLLMVIGSVWADTWTEDFESNPNTAYGDDSVTISDRVWTKYQAGNFGYGNSTVGSYAFTINDDKVGAHITTPVLNTCGTVSFKYGFVNGSADNVFVLQTSTDGVDFTTLDTHTLGDSANEALVDYSYPINNDSTTLYIRVLSDDQNAHLFIDDFTVTDYVAGGNPAPTISGIATTPENPTETDEVTITANVSDDNAVSSVVLNWGTATDALTNEIVMNEAIAPEYTTATAIPAQTQGTTIYYQITAMDNEDAQSTSAVMNYEIPLPTQVVTIAEIQGTDADSPLVGQTVQTSGIVTFKDGSKWAIQNGSGAFNGVWLYGASDAVIGDEVTVEGEISEYNGLTQISSPVTTIISSGNTMPAVTIVTTDEVKNEQYEGVFVRVEDAECTVVPNNYGEWEVNNGTLPENSCVIDDELFAFEAVLGTNYNVQGVLTYSYGAFKIEPRDENDVEEITAENPAPTISDIVMTPENPSETDEVTITVNITDDESVASVTLNWGTANDTLTNEVIMNITTAPEYSGIIPVQAVGTTVYYQITATDNEDGVATSAVMNYEIPTAAQVVTIAEIQGTDADSPLVGQTIQTSGIVTFKAGNKWTIQDGTGAYNGVWLYGATDAVIGDEVTVVGDVAEFYGLTQITGNPVTTILSSGNTMPEVTVLSTSAVNDEQYEGVFVKVENAECTVAPNNYGEWEVNDSTGACLIDAEAYEYNATLGTNYNVQGVLIYSYGAYKIEPRDANDVEEIVTGNPAPTISDVAITPENPTETDEVSITANVTDDNTVSSVVLNWGIADDALTNEIIMSVGTAPEYTTSTVIPAQAQGTTVYYQIIATDNEDAQATTSVMNYEIPADTQTVTIAEIQGTTDESPLLGQTVQTTGIVTFVDGPKWAIQSETGAYNGLWLYGATDAVIGDEVTVTGDVAEYYGKTQLTGDLVIVINSNGNTLPAPVVLLTSAIADEQYEGVLVRVETAVCTNPDLGNGEWELNNGTTPEEACRVNDELFAYDATLNNSYNVQGVLNYDWSNFKIEPRDESDVEELADTNAPTIVAVNIVSETELEVVFSEAVEQVSAETLANYAINSRLNITAVVLNTEDATKVSLTTETISDGNYTLTITNVADLNSNAITSETFDFNYVAQIADGILVINEIHYNPSTEQGDDNIYEFLELVNTSSDVINLEGYHFAGFNYTFGDVTIDADEYIVLAVADTTYAGNGYDVYEIESGGFSNGGETVTLYDAFDRVIDEVTYDDSDPWTTTPDGNGSSLELISTDLDNSLATSWQGSYVINGTPGAVNSEATLEANVTFQLSMDSITPSENGVHVMGSFNDWNPAEISMIDDNDDLIYSAVVTLTPGETVQYKFVNGNTAEGAEEIARVLVVPGEDLVLPVVDFNDNVTPEGGLFFSEYIEGSSSNKAVEIFNAMDIEIDLAGYRVVYHKHSGGNTMEIYQNFDQGTLIAGGDVFAVATNQADAALQDEADLVLAYTGDGTMVHFNGDDALALERLNSDNEWEVVDIIGIPDVTPETAYAAAGVADATKEHTLVRKSTVTTGNPDWSASAGTNDADSEWIVYPQDTFDYFGAHTMGADVTAPVIDNVIVTSDTELDVIFSEPVDETTAETIANYTLSTRISVTAVELDDSSASTVHMTVADMSPANYTLTVTDVADVNGNAIISESFNFVVEDLLPLPMVEISEIMYNPASDLGDDSEYEYLELHNYGTEEADLSGFIFTSGIEFTFPENSTLAADEYLLVAVNSANYSGNGYDVYDFTGALGNSGELITIQDGHNRTLDTVEYADTGDWPSSADGTGPSLELITAGSDNSLPENWQASYELNGTPGAVNSTQPTEATPYTITQIQTEDHTGEYVQTYGYITSVFSAGDSYLFTIQDGTGENSGIWAEAEFDVDYIDEVVQITGTVVESYDLTKINVEDLVIALPDHPSTREMPEPEVLDTSVAGTEPWEGVLVKVQGACNSENPDGENDYGEWQINDGSGDLRIDDLGFLFEPTLDQNYEVVGVVNYAFGNFKVEPRTDEDVTHIVSNDNEISFVNTLKGNYPNPFNPVTTIHYSIENQDNVSIVVYNVLGQKVKTLVNETKELGNHTIKWNGSDDNNNSVSSGVYFYKIQTGKFTSTKKMLLLK